MKQQVKVEKFCLLVIVWLVSMVVSSATAQTQGYTLGDVVTNFQLTSVDNRTVSLAEYNGNKGLIVVFTSNHCPFAKAYEDRLIALNQQFSSQGFPIVAIMSNDPAAYEADSFEQMQLRARNKQYAFAYVLDGTQQVAKAFGATRTPQAYVLRNRNGQFTVEYIGSIDDSPQDAGSAQHHYLADAVMSLLAGRPVQTPLTKPIGCGITWK